MRFCSNKNMVLYFFESPILWFFVKKWSHDLKKKKSCVTTIAYNVQCTVPFISDLPFKKVNFYVFPPYITYVLYRKYVMILIWLFPKVIINILTKTNIVMSIIFCLSGYRTVLCQLFDFPVTEISIIQVQMNQLLIPIRIELR